MNPKRGQVWDTLIPWLIALAVLLLALGIYFVISGKGSSAIDYFKNLLRVG